MLMNGWGLQHSPMSCSPGVISVYVSLVFPNWSEKLVHALQMNNEILLASVSSLINAVASSYFPHVKVCTHLSAHTQLEK